MNNVLICWTEVPAQMGFVELEVAEGRDTEELEAMHNHFINSTETPDEIEEKINKYFYTEDGEFRFPSVAGPMKNTPYYDLIIVTGIIL